MYTSFMGGFFNRTHIMPLDTIYPETFNESDNDGFVRNMWYKFNENFPRYVSHMSGICGYFAKIINLIDYFKINTNI